MRRTAKRKTLLTHPTRWTVVVGARLQRFDTKTEAEEALAKAEAQGQSAYILPPASATGTG
jgi:hypothetical protein